MLLWRNLFDGEIKIYNSFFKNNSALGTYGQGGAIKD